MPRAHVCQSCGRDLALIAPAREPHYGWLLVSCPGCASASVRAAGMGGDRCAWRKSRKVAKALLGLWGRGMVVGLLTLLMAGAIGTLEEETRQLAMGSTGEAVQSWRGPLVLLGVLEPAAGGFASTRAGWLSMGGNLFLLVGWGFGCFLSATFLMTLLRHLRWWVVVLGWCGWLAGVMMLAQVVLPALAGWVEAGSSSGRPAVGVAVSIERLMRMPGQLAWVAASGVVMAALTPVGLMVRRGAAELVRRQRWRIRKRIRRRNQSA